VARGSPLDRRLAGILPAVDLAGIAFDAFGTLFDLSALRVRTREVASHEGDELFASLKQRLIPWTWHATAAGDYVPFPELAVQALGGAARQQGFPLERSRAEYIVAGLRELPVFDDVRTGLARLDALGVPLAILSNGTADGVDALVAHNDLDGVFEHVLVADSVKRFKPAKEVYGLATQAFEAAAGRVMLVSGHEWDVAGASGAGLKTAWLARGERLAPVRGIEPDIEAADVADLALRLTRPGAAV
jgi:2-haloacid dehalogenase